MVRKRKPFLPYFPRSISILLTANIITEAGLTLGRLSRSRTAVYTAVMTNDYQAISESDAYNLGTNAAAGTGKAMLSNRISWFFDLKGPSLTLDTACSSGLYGLHLACQGLKSYECDQALVTGVNLILHPCLMAQLSQMHMISPDGVSHSFDSSANGEVLTFLYPRDKLLFRLSRPWHDCPAGRALNMNYIACPLPISLYTY